MNNHRLQVARRLPVSLSCACMSAHVTKSVLVAMVIFTKEARELPYTSILTMFFLIFMMIKVLLQEVPIDIPRKQVCQWSSMRKFVCCLFTGFTPICWVWTIRVVLQYVSLFSLCLLYSHTCWTLSDDDYLQFSFRWEKIWWFYDSLTSLCFLFVLYTYFEKWRRWF